MFQLIDFQYLLNKLLTIKTIIEMIIAPTEKSTDPTKKFIVDCSSNLLLFLY